MRHSWLLGALAGLLLPATAAAQSETNLSPTDSTASAILNDVQASRIRALNATGAALKGLDKVSGEVTDVTLSVGDTAEVGRVAITLGECRYPEDNPSGEAYAWLSIRDMTRDRVVFEGWMVASSPALSALDHARYDVWVIRCTTA